MTRSVAVVYVWAILTVLAIAACARGAELLDVETSLIAKANAERARYGLPALEVSDRRMQTARQHCLWMTRNGMVHGNNYGGGEIIAAGQRNASAAISAWMNSPGHRALLLGRFTKCGFAGYVAPNGTCYWCGQFE